MNINIFYLILTKYNQKRFDINKTRVSNFNKVQGE